MKTNEERVVEIRSLGYRWPEDQILSWLAQCQDGIDKLRRGARLDIGEDMGSCQCGDITAHVYLRDGQCWCTSHGSMAWQQYDGPASECRVPYMVGARSQKFAALVSGGALQYHSVGR